MKSSVSSVLGLDSPLPPGPLPSPPPSPPVAIPVPLRPPTVHSPHQLEGAKNTSVLMPLPSLKSIDGLVLGIMSKVFKVAQWDVPGPASATASIFICHIALASDLKSDFLYNYLGSCMASHVTVYLEGPSSAARGAPAWKDLPAWTTQPPHLLRHSASEVLCTPHSSCQRGSSSPSSPNYLILVLIFPFVHTPCAPSHPRAFAQAIAAV